MIPKKSRTRPGSGMSSIMLDIMFDLVMFFMLLAYLKSQELTKVSEIALTVPGLKVELTGLKTKIGLLTNTIEGQRITIGELNSQKGGLELAVGKLQDEIGEYKSRFQSGKPLTVLFLIDTTISMEKPIQELGKGLETICEVMANRSQDFRVGIIGFRQGETSRFEITPIKPVYEDEGSSQMAVLSFIQGLELQPSATEHKSVFQAAVHTLAKAHPTADPERRIILCLLGDVGPSELDGKPGYTSAEEEQAKRDIHAGLKRWVQMGDHAVMTLYAESEHTQADPSATENKQWFQDLGSVSPESSHYTDTTALLQAIHHAIGK